MMKQRFRTFQGRNHRGLDGRRPSAADRRKRASNGIGLQPARRTFEHLRRGLPAQGQDPGEDQRDAHGRPDRGVRDWRRPHQLVEL